jgi:hypothetical protein
LSNNYLQMLKEIREKHKNKTLSLHSICLEVN